MGVVNRLGYGQLDPVADLGGGSDPDQIIGSITGCQTRHGWFRGDRHDQIRRAHASLPSLQYILVVATMGCRDGVSGGDEAIRARVNVRLHANE